MQILMSTFNGEKYLVEQLASLAHQTHHPIKLLIRDDGSSDGTRKILSDFLDSSPLDASLICGSNIGVIRSFFELLKGAAPGSDYYAFCDQDDVWQPGKLDRARSRLKDVPSDIPAMYGCRTEMVDENLIHQGYWPPIPNQQPSFNNAIIENVAVGCTVVINRAAREWLLRSIPDPDKIIMHDWWIYLCMSAFGQVVYDSEPTILYRQHASNVMGGSTGFIHKWARKYRSFRKNGKQYLLRKQAAEFHRIHGSHLPEKQRIVLNKFLNSNTTLLKRAGYACTTELYRNSLLENCLFRFLYLFNRI